MSLDSHTQTLKRLHIAMTNLAPVGRTAGRATFRSDLLWLAFLIVSLHQRPLRRPSPDLHEIEARYGIRQSVQLTAHR
jgi:hypothetical protein